MVLRTLGKVIAATAATVATTYLGTKFLQWAGAKPKIEKKNDNLPDVQRLPKDRID